MALATQIPGDERRPGQFFIFRIGQGARGLTPLPGRVALVGTRASNGSQPANQPVQVFSSADADVRFGQSSPAALMARAAFAAGRDRGASPEIWVVGMPEPASEQSTAAAYRLAITGAVGASGTIRLRIAGRTIKLGVARNTALAEVSTALDTAIDSAAADLPVAALAAGTDVLLTSRVRGENGNGLVIDILETPPGLAIEPAQVESGTGVSDMTAALDALLTTHYQFVAVENHHVDDVAALLGHADECWHPAEKRWRQLVMAETGTLATAMALQATANDFRQIVIGAESFPQTPAQLATYMAVVFATTRDPATSVDRVELPGIALPASESDLPLGSEINTALANGVTILGANDNRTTARVEKGITTQTTRNNVPFDDLVDVSVVQALIYGTRQIEIAVGAGFEQPKNTARKRGEIRSVVLSIMRELEEREIWEDVDGVLRELVVVADPTDPTRAVVEIPAKVVKPLHQILHNISVQV